MKQYRLIIVVILSLAIGGLGISPAAALTCMSSCPECKPVQQMNCCGTAMHQHGSLHAVPMQPISSQTPVQCQGEFCADLYNQADDIVLNEFDPPGAQAPAPHGFHLEATVSSTPQRPPLIPDRSVQTVSLYTLHCSYLN